MLSEAKHLLFRRPRLPVTRNFRAALVPYLRALKLGAKMGVLTFTGSFRASLTRKLPPRERARPRHPWRKRPADR
jgi:hypothetical protein